ncbi:transglutaminase-like cysteine peptidase [Larsenimonas suaedae]|uniref:Transglutaminase-like cysteine peptidase n=1 Tax=Larsenimonas suaedae TaxID=1851019 RepID=A0ABU1GTL0_9GAMM|nr:transglutaminase-like cysteine peptidase [Larsenimonas suaedae]MCM2971812.1 transglutaminase-like cysteine peptidase [Larsenimonas suaedae]MDR5895364.1 transglutaminase-like cysteine peptidase [Larsenimonas suaedae]
MRPATLGLLIILTALAQNAGATVTFTYWNNVDHHAVTTTESALIARARALPVIERLTLINRVVNNAANQTPTRPNEWRGFASLIRHGEGDCEDFALAKYQLLRKTGIADERLRLYAMKDQFSPALHMVLGYQDRNQTLILDNLTLRVLSLKQRDDLTPLYSFNQQSAERWNQHASTPIPLTSRLTLDGQPLSERAARLMDY